MRTFALAALRRRDATAGTSPPPAFAQDSLTMQPFTGPRVGVIVGYDRLQPGSGPNSNISSDRKTADGVTYGVRVSAYDAAIGSTVIGAEGEVTGSTDKGDHDPATSLRRTRLSAG